MDFRVKEGMKALMSEVERMIKEFKGTIQG